jgi:hypothetical protein
MNILLYTISNTFSRCPLSSTQSRLYLQLPEVQPHMSIYVELIMFISCFPSVHDKHYTRQDTGVTETVVYTSHYYVETK